MIIIQVNIKHFSPMTTQWWCIQSITTHNTL